MSALTSCLEGEAAAIAAAAQRLNSAQVEAALELLAGCRQRRSKLVVTGVGKSGIVARKIAATFSSIGLTAVFLNPVDALHGDLGIVAADDVALLLSNSGETEELLAIIPHLRRRGTARIALVGRLGSSLATCCDVVLDGSVDREVCPLNLAPTASTAVAMAIGDALAAVWMERAGISPEDFAINHPAGSLGRQLTLTVADLMVPATDLEGLSPQAPLAEVIGQLTQGSNGKGSLGAAWVQASGDPRQMAGLITDGDLRRTLQRHPPESWASIRAGAMATADPITVAPQTLAITALELMERNPRQAISVLPVVDPARPGQLLGLLRLHDLVQAGFSTHPAAERP
ncbi:KpsF/GutQ family sugar-phosphate isomerase [Synechococcus sp. CS-1331]|uniref:KpsF/GutQ family sugar-phosphate isomerase n=1 Tax=Synechococcus sp. CS-1331 TaxID=2847973 RepID=UPI00223B2BF5|nr:KpsF/GutQ family sugar-phosphate isomerase [Synechococcus sp. CS-1331]MCT0228065.1 KpsF/GutQ family sugar-phosphate isomerase [Synechococcus sp. CS-1331]